MNNCLEQFIFDYWTVHNGLCFYKIGTDFNERYVVIDYDFNGVYCVKLNNKDRKKTKVYYFNKEECEQFTIE